MFGKEKVVVYIESLSLLLQESSEIGEMDSGVYADILELMRMLASMLKEEVKAV